MKEDTETGAFKAAEYANICLKKFLIIHKSYLILAGIRVAQVKIYGNK